VQAVEQALDLEPQALAALPEQHSSLITSEHYLRIVPHILQEGGADSAGGGAGPRSGTTGARGAAGAILFPQKENRRAAADGLLRRRPASGAAAAARRRGHRPDSLHCDGAYKT